MRDACWGFLSVVVVDTDLTTGFILEGDVLEYASRIQADLFYAGYIFLKRVFLSAARPI